MSVERIDTADVITEIKGPIQKRCPVKDEIDYGAVRIQYRTHGSALELHSLAAYLATFSDRRQSHEDCTTELAQTLGCDVTTMWTTAGLEVSVEVLRESVNAEDS